MTICASAIEACKNAEAVVIATEWKEFRDINWEEVYANMNKPAFVFDGRLLVDADKLRKIGFKVCSQYLDSLCNPDVFSDLGHFYRPRGTTLKYHTEFHTHT